MTDIDLTEPYACRNGWKAYAIKVGELLIGRYVDGDSGTPVQTAWLLNGHYYGDTPESAVDLVNLPAPKREPLVRWAVVDQNGAFISTWSTFKAALKFSGRSKGSSVVKLVEAPDDQS